MYNQRRLFAAGWFAALGAVLAAGCAVFAAFRLLAALCAILAAGGFLATFGFLGATGGFLLAAIRCASFRANTSDSKQHHGEN